MKYPWKPYRRSDDIESFVHAYIYLVLRYHVTDVDSLAYEIKSRFEGVSVVDGIKVGGEGKRNLFKSTGLPFVVVDNPELQKVLDLIVANCMDSYSKINFQHMDRLYGFGRKAAAPTAVDALDLAGLNNDDGLPMPEGTDENLVNTVLGAGNQRTSEEDPCVVKGFLSEPGKLVSYLRAHATCRRLDKADDQFKVRENEEVFEGGNPATNRRVGALSITGSVQSSQGSREASNLPKPRARPFNRGVSSPSTSGASSESKKRVRAEEVPKVTEAEERGAEGMARRNKRTKAMLTHQVEDD